MPNVFREIPPYELLQEYAELYGLSNLYHQQWFTKDQCNLEKITESILCIYPYYNPCKGVFLKDPLTYESAFKVLRHLLKAHDFSIIYKEKSRGGKQIWYRIESDKMQSLTEIHNISFE